MKICTVFEIVNENPRKLKAKSFSVVNDDHEFGWYGNEYHYEGQILEVKHVDS